MILVNGKDMNEEYECIVVLKKKPQQLCFFLKKLPLVIVLFINRNYRVLMFEFDIGTGLEVVIKYVCSSDISVQHS